jgi:hypothetical protein
MRGICMAIALSLVLAACGPRPPALLAPADLRLGSQIFLAVDSTPDPDHVLRASTRGPDGARILFVDLPRKLGGRVPAVLHAVGPAWEERALIDTEAQGMGWVYVGGVGEGVGMLGVLEDLTHSPGRPLLIVSSPDSGRTWYLRGRATPPHLTARFDGLALDAYGRGTLRLRIDEQARAPIPAGVWILRTEDAGLTWSTPEREAAPPGEADAR